MDPLTAFSLTCGVIQVVDFSTKVVVKCREIYKHGASSKNKEIESMATHLTDLAADLRLPTTSQGHGSASQLYHDDQELLKLAEQCSSTAMELTNELQKLSISGRPRKRDVVRKAIKTVWMHDTIEDIQRSLERYRRMLDTRILISLRQYVHINASEHSDDFKNLDRKLQSLIIGITSNQNTFDVLKDHISAENTSSKEHTSHEFQKHREITAAKETKEKILESLYFPDIHARQETIVEAHKNTFEWIFDNSGTEVRSWHSFIDWLESGHGTYWISGKAGSGKSTLMNFLCNDPRTTAALRVWSGTNEVLMPKFFFWAPGSELQKSLAGLIRSLIYQIVDATPDLMGVLATSLSPSQQSFHQLPTWTEQRLRVTLQNLLSVESEQYRLCIFIDGLDEFYGDQLKLLELIRNLIQSTTVKFCLSSRPYPLFSHELGSSPMLKLQDLTERDIRSYVFDKLGKLPSKASQITSSPSEIGDTVDKIVGKAEGVFLWVNLAVKDQIEGIRNGDDAEQLQKRLDILPTEIEEVYSHMLRGIDKVYQEEVARYIRFVLDVGETSISLFALALAEHKRIDDILLSSPDISIIDIRQHCKRIGERIATTCKGFLEVREAMDSEAWQKEVVSPSATDWPHMTEVFSESLKGLHITPKEREDLTETKFFHECTRIDFLHRTAFEFFTDNEQGKEFLKTHTSANPHPQTLYVKALLANLVIFPVPTDDHKVLEFVDDIMQSARYAEDLTQGAQPELMDLLNRIITKLCQKSRGQPPNIHWCRLCVVMLSPPWRSLIMFDEPRVEGISSTSEPRKFNPPDPYPVDFLGFAATWGLGKFVEYTLDSRPARQKPGTLDYLLRCSVYGSLTSALPPSHFSLITALLDRGAYPNAKFSNGITVWGMFLSLLFRHYNLSNSFLHDSTGTNCKDAVLAFFASGANPNEKAQCLEFRPFNAEGVNEFYAVRLRLSARSVLLHCFANSPIFTAIEDVCIASGASICVDNIEVLFQSKDHEYWLISRLSERRSTQFLNSWMERMCREDFDLHGPGFDEFIQELDVAQLYRQMLQNEEAAKILPQSENPQENQSSNDTNTISPGASADAPISPTLTALRLSDSSSPSQEEI